MTVEWGPVSAWVGSLLTGGSLLLGFNIMRRDRARDEAAEARLLSCSVRGQRSDLIVRVSNAGSLPIHHLATAVAMRSEVEEAGGRRPRSVASLPDHGIDIAPGAVDVEVFRASRIDDSAPVPVYVSFTDSSGRRWRRGFDGRLERHRTYDPFPWERVAGQWVRFGDRARQRADMYGYWWEHRRARRSVKNEPHYRKKGSL